MTDAFAILRHRRPLDEGRAVVVDDHRASLRTPYDRGLLTTSGPLDPRSGGALLLRVNGTDGGSVQETLDRVRDDDPFTKTGMAPYELLPRAPTIGKEMLDRI